MSNEARGESYDYSRFAVGYVVMNRLRDKEYPKTICNVAYQNNQFENIHKHRIPKYLEEKYLRLAQMVYTHQAPNPIGNRKYFNTKNLGKRFRTRNSPIILGNHIFY